MTSIYKPTIKVLFVSLAISASIGLSVLSTAKQSQASTSTISKTKVKSNATEKAFKPMSQYEKKVHRDLSKLLPGSKQFNPRFLNLVLTSNSKK